MTLKELKERVDHAMLQERNHDLEVKIVLDEPSMGPTATTSVRSCTVGIDWNLGDFLIAAQDPIARKRKSNL